MLNAELVKKYKIEDSADFVKCGFEFEFFTKEDFKSSQLAKTLTDFLGKKVKHVEQNYQTVDNVTDYSTFLLTEDWSGGAKMYELVTSPLVYKESIGVLKKMYE